MIPQHLIDKAVKAAESGYAIPDVTQHAKTVHQVRTALETVAADIWDEGHRTDVQRGPDDCRCHAWNEGECGCGEYGTGPIITPNPYRASETA